LSALNRPARSITASTDHARELLEGWISRRPRQRPWAALPTTTCSRLCRSPRACTVYSCAGPQRAAWTLSDSSHVALSPSASPRTRARPSSAIPQKQWRVTAFVVAGEFVACCCFPLLPRHCDRRFLSVWSAGFRARGVRRGPWHRAAGENRVCELRCATPPPPHSGASRQRTQTPSSRESGRTTKPRSSHTILTRASRTVAPAPVVVDALVVAGNHERSGRPFAARFQRLPPRTVARALPAAAAAHHRSQPLLRVVSR
jgi:hypothetical protein